MSKDLKTSNVQALAGRGPGFIFYFVSVAILFAAAMFAAIGVVQGKPLESAGPSIIFALFVSVFVYAIASARHRSRMHKTFTYAWYSTTFPDHVSPRGVRCRHCGSGKITIRNLMQQTFQRAHVCQQCGETLYFSPEAGTA